MKRVDRLILLELLGPFFMGLGLFGTLVFTSVMLNRITEWIVQGIAPARVLEMSLLLSPAILVRSAAMSCLLAALLAFGRMTNDSEIVAVRAAGASLIRIMRPVFLFGLTIGTLVFTVNETLVPWASERANAMQLELRRQLDSSSGQRNINRMVKFSDGRVGMLGAMDFSLVHQTLRNASLVIYSKDGEPQWWLHAEELQYFDERDWRLSGNSWLISGDGADVISISDGAWPQQLSPLDVKPKNLLAGFVNDLDVFSMEQIREEIQQMRSEPNPNRSQLANLEFGYWNKIALPISTIIFALLGAPLGIRRQRTGPGSGFAMSIAVVFGYVTVANWLAVYAKGGTLAPAVASFTPLAVGFAAAAIVIWRKNM